MQRRQALQTLAGAAAGSLLPSPALCIARKTPEAARFDAFYTALETRPWLRGFVGQQNLHSRAAMQPLFGRLPEELHGSLYRNGPAFHDLGGERFGHWFDAPGLVQRFQLGQGQVVHTARLVGTRRNVQEVTSDTMQFSAFGTGRPDLSSGGSADGQNVGNISLLSHAGELLALWEGGSPHLIHRETLETEGRKTWSPETEGLPFSAHTRLDADGSLWSIGYSPDPAGVLLYHISATGQVEKLRFLPLEAGPMIQDFVVTESKILLIIPPFTARDQTTDAFLDRYTWQQDQPTRLLVFDKNNLSLIGETQTDPFWVFHFGGGYDASAQEIVCDFSCHSDTSFMEVDAYAMMEGTWDGHVSAGLAYLTLRLNVATGAVQLEKRKELGQVEFLKTDPRAALQNHRHTLMLAEREGTPGFGRLVLYDRVRETAQTYDAPNTEMMEEHLMVPKPNSEGFWIVGTSQDWAQQKTHFSVYEGARINEGPRFMAMLEGLVPLGLHGIFI